MRTFRLAQSVIEAEKLRFQLRLRRIAVRIVVGAAAGGFVLAAIACGHFAAYLWLGPKWGGIATALALAGADLALALLLLLVTLRGGPSAAELEAKLIRDQAWRETVRALTLAGLLQPLIGLLLARFRKTASIGKVTENSGSVAEPAATAPVVRSLLYQIIPSFGVSDEQARFLSSYLASALAAFVLLSGAAVALSACNTTAGAGEDVSATGHAVTNSAEKVKSAL